jgi:hypothetical protein
MKQLVQLTVDDRIYGLSWEQIQYLKAYYEETTGIDPERVFAKEWNETKPYTEKVEGYNTAYDALQSAIEYDIPSELVVERLNSIFGISGVEIEKDSENNL